MPTPGGARPAATETPARQPTRTPRVTVSKRSIVISVATRTRITIERRSGKRWVRVTRLTTGKRLRRTVKPGVYRVTVGAVRRQVRVQ